MNVVAHLQDEITAHGAAQTVTFLPEHGDPVRLTVTDLDRQARATAAWLTAEHLTDQAVLLLYPAGIEFLIAFLGCLYARVLAIPAPLPEVGSQHSARVEHLIRDAAATRVLTDSAHQLSLAAELPDIPVSTISPQTDPTGWNPPRTDSATIAYLQYTSGSTTAPRGVPIHHGALLHNLGTIRALADEPARVLAGWLPHYHDMGLVGLQLHALYSGADLVLTAPATFVARPVRWLQMITDYRADWAVGPDFGYAWCTRRVTDAHLADLDLSSLTMAVTGAEPIRATTLAAFTDRFATVGFRHEAWAPCYGMAEATLMITGTRQGNGPTVRRFDVAALENHHAHRTPDGKPLVASGRPVDLDLRIVDPDTHETHPPDRVGEIWVAGDSIAAGYHGHPDDTRETFHAGTGSFLRTGDLGFLHDGNLYVTGRLKDVIIVNGRNIYPHDIEETARLAHHAAGPGAAFSITDSAGAEHVVLMQELRRDYRPTDDIADAIRTALSKEFGISVTVELVAHGAVNKTTSGKIRRARMRERFLRGTYPQGDRMTTDDIRAWLIAQLAAYLDVPAAGIDPTTTLRSYHLDSVHALALGADIADTFGVLVEPTLTWDHPTIDAIASHLTDKLADDPLGRR